MELTMQPTELVLAHNQVPVEVTVGDVVTEGVFAVNELLINSTAIIGTELWFVFGDFKVVLQVKSVVDAAVDLFGSIPVLDGLDTLSTYRNKVYNILRVHPVLSSFYDITYTIADPSIFFASKFTGVQYTMTEFMTGEDNIGDLDMSYNWRNLTVGALGTDDIIIPSEVDLILLAEEVMASGKYTPMVTLTGSADTLNKVKWDLQGNLTSLFSSTFLPQFVSAVRVIYDLTWRFRLFFNGIGSFSNQPNFYVALNMGVKKEDFAKFGSFETEVLGNKFLSWRGNNRYITRNQIEMLYFLQNIDRYEYMDGHFDALQLYVKTYYANGSSTTEMVSSETTCQEYGIIEFIIPRFDTYFAALELVSGSTVSYFEVWVNHRLVEENPGGVDIVASEVVNYYLVEDGYLDTYFIIRNSFGVFESIRATGTKTNEFSTQKSLLRRVLQAGYETTEGESEYYQTMFEERWEVTIQANNAQEFEWMKELLLSKDAYLLSGEILVKVLIEPGSFEMAKDDAYDWLLTFNYRFANVNSKFSIIV